MREYSNVNIVDIGSDARIELRYDDAMAEHSVRCEIIGTGGMDRLSVVQGWDTVIRLQ